MVWSLSVVSDYLFVAERRTENMFARNLVFGVAKLAIVVALVLAGDGGAFGVFVAWVAGCALSLVVAYGVLMPRLARRYRPAFAGVAGEVREMAVSFAGNYFITLGYLLTTFLLPLIVVVRLSTGGHRVLLRRLAARRRLLHGHGVRRLGAVRGGIARPRDAREADALGGPHLGRAARAADADLPRRRRDRSSGCSATSTPTTARPC